MKFQSPGIAGEIFFCLDKKTKGNEIFSEGCGAYGYDINQLCSAWREAPQEMTKEQYQASIIL